MDGFLLDVTLSGEHIDAIFDLFDGRTPARTEVGHVFEAFLRSIVEQIPGATMSTVSPMGGERNRA